MTMDWSKYIDDDGKEWEGEEAGQIKEITEFEKILEMQIRSEQRTQTQEIWNLKKAGQLTREALTDFHNNWRQNEMIRMSVGSVMDRKNLFDKKTQDILADLANDDEAPESEADLVAEAKQLASMLSDRVKGAQSKMRKAKKQAAYEEDPEEKEDKIRPIN